MKKNDMNEGDAEFGKFVALPYPPTAYQSNDEIDVVGLITEIIARWRVLVSITLIGTVLGTLISFLLPSLYEVEAKVARPVEANIQVLKTEGIEDFSTQKAFNRFLQELGSVDRLKQYMFTGGWLEKFYPNTPKENFDRVFSLFSEGFEIEILVPKKEKGEENRPNPQLVSVEITTDKEKLGVDFLNSYIDYLNDQLINEIKNEGLLSVKLLTKDVNDQIALLRKNAKTKRLLKIEKLENNQAEKIKTLENEVELLLEKEKLDRKSKIFHLKEALYIANKMNINKPTTIEALAATTGAKTMVNLNTGNNQYQDALMGSVFLKSEIENLENRDDSFQFIPEISKLKKEIESLKNDEQIVALKQRQSDDPYIDELPGLLKKLDELNNESFEFNSAHLFRWNKKAIVDDKAEKPNKKLIIAVSFVLSAFIALFFVLIVNAIEKRKLENA